MTCRNASHHILGDEMLSGPIHTFPVRARPAKQAFSEVYSDLLQKLIVTAHPESVYNVLQRTRD
jgi:hypothetical protein